MIQTRGLELSVILLKRNSLRRFTEALTELPQPRVSLCTFIQSFIDVIPGSVDEDQSKVIVTYP